MASKDEDGPAKTRTYTIGRPRGLIEPDWESDAGDGDEAGRVAEAEERCGPLTDSPGPDASMPSED